MNQTNETDCLFKGDPGGFEENFIMEQKKLDWRIVVAAMIIIGAIEITALLKDVNGALMVLTVAAIAGLAGYVIPSPVTLK